jgi:aminotransferase in exopolysaccharide biosynthesis
VKKNLSNNEIVSFIKELYPSQQFIPLHTPKFSQKEKDYVLDTIESTYVSSVGKYVDKFEKMMCDYTGAKHAIAVVNGTAALHISLLLAGVKQGDLVLTQALSFIATCNAISYIGAEPCFIDVDSSTLGLSAQSLESFLQFSTYITGQVCFEKSTNKRISACVPMHTFGFPTEIDAIVEICSKYYIPVVEDSAESIGSIYKNKHTGTFGLLGTYSFNGNKTITCGGGGIVVTNNDELGKKAKHLTTQAKVPHKWEFFHDHIGFNYRCPNLNAALACAQLERLEDFILNKRETANAYRNFFEGTNIKFNTETSESRSNFWLNSVMFESINHRDEFLEYSNSNGVMTRPIWALMHRMKMFENSIHDGLSNSIEIESCLVNLPSSVRI